MLAHKMSYPIIFGCLIGSAILAGIVRSLMNDLTFLQLYEQALQFRGPRRLSLLGNALDFTGNTKYLLIGAFAILLVVWMVQLVRIWGRKRRHFLSLAAKLPGPKPLPLIGNALQFACKPEELLDRTIEAIMPYEDLTPMRFWLGPWLHVVITEPRHIEIILNSQKSSEKGSVYRLLYPIIGEGLISGSDQTWRSHRKLFAPMMDGRTLEGYIDIVQRHAEIFIDKLKPLANGVRFDIEPYLARCTVDVVSEIMSGCRDVNTQENPDQEFIHATDKLYQIVHTKMMKVWLYPDCIFRLSPIYQEQKKCLRIIHDFTEKLIAAAKKKELATSPSRETDNVEGTNSILEKIHEKLKQDPHILSDEQLRDEMKTIYTASQDTMSMIGNFILLMLGIHKDIQEKVRNEVLEMLSTDTIVARSLSSLKYLEMVVKETLRLFPTAPLLVRKLRSDLALDTCVLPGGCDVVIASYVTQRSSRFWKDPTKFIPERFTAEETARRHPYAYIPFSGGLMGCIGQKFAIMALKTIVANVVRSYRIDSTLRMEDIKLKSDISIRCINGFNISLESL